jgi:hypothetical protein
VKINKRSISYTKKGDVNMSKWRHKINIKEYFSDDESSEAAKTVCEKLIPQLERILITENNRPEDKKLDGDFLDEFQNLISEFKWVVSSIENNEDPEEYSFDTWCEAFNEYLNQLYDIGDTISTDGLFYDREKFLWVG